MKTNLVFPILLFTIVFQSCQNKPKEIKVVDSELISVTRTQFESEKMEFGEPMTASFSDMVHFTGTIVPSVNGWAQISLPVPGLISKIYCNPGQMIGMGGILLEVSGNEMIDLQKEFAESAALLSRFKSEYERVKNLNVENIASKKELILAESTYFTERAKFNALKMKLENIGLDVAKIEGGTFYSSYSLKSPINGYVARINANIGQHIESQQNTADIIDTRTLQLRLSVFDKDITRVKEDQNVEFFFTGNRIKKFRSKISSVGKTIYSETKSVDCFAAIEDMEDNNFVSNQFVEGDILVTTDTVMAIQETAIINAANKSYVMRFEKEDGELYYFRKTEVSTGRTSHNMVEITTKIPLGKLLVKGVYNITIE